MGIAAVDQVAELVKVCFETGAFLADVGTIGKEGEFFEEAFVVGSISSRAFEGVDGGIALLSGGLLCFLSNHLALLLWVFELFGDLRKGSTLFTTHGVEIRGSLNGV